uniref:O-linked GlcNAc transferase n=1 Tax=uncultured Thiotrichaceae bacterium TaxID=298394 RepID=A0A6S6U901_9GAMM|nr:MAG: O-linked GlcNAc transferase [uncultured Thiotrichaceae bacterium]
MRLLALAKQLASYHFAWKSVKADSGKGSNLGRGSLNEVKWACSLFEQFTRRRGCYMLELLPTTYKDKSVTIHLRIECVSLVMPVEVIVFCLSGRLNKRIIWLPGAISDVSLRWAEDDVRLQSVDFRLKRLLGGFARKRMLERVSKYHPVSSAQSGIQYLPEFSVFSQKVYFKRLYGLYQDTFASCAGSKVGLIEGVPYAELQAMLNYPSVDLDPESDEFREDALNIHWVTCDFAPKGGGGNMTIFRFVRLFELFGHHQHIWLHNKSSHSDAVAAYESLVRNYQQTSAQVHFIADEPDGFKQATGDIIIATDWQSVWPVLSVSGFKRRFYFVQDYEPSFFAAGGYSLAAGMTYREDLDCICAGPWLEKLMVEQHGRWATKFWLSVDRNVYYPVKDWPSNEVPRVAFYARNSTSRRAVELGLLALEYMVGQGVDFHVDVFGSNEAHTLLRDVSFSWTDWGVLNSDELGDLYRCCDVGMVFSATNYSLVPQEMMACRLAVLELDGDNTRTVFPDGGVVLAEPHPRYIADKLAFLVTHAEERQQVALNGMKWADQFDWEETARAVNADMQHRLVELGYKKEVVSSPQAIKVSVVIPTWNGGDLLMKVLDAVQMQSTPWPYDILVIDSGSNDGSLEKMQNRTDIRLHVIPQSEFSHGGTRNLGVEMTDGEYIAFLTQDALPADEFWLFHLVSALEHDEEAAGAFGKHLPWSDAPLVVKRDIEAHFERLSQYPLYLSKETDRIRFDSGDQGWRQVLHFYSDNNSCMRRSVWEKIPYPVIDYGEDQVWADQIIKAGYKKAYAVNAVVYHSHEYDEKEAFERNRTEADFFYEQFGYLLIEGEER